MNSSSQNFSRGPRLREISLRLIFPNLITVLAICSGLSGVRLALEQSYEKAVFMVLLAAFLDGIDGKVARMMKATSKFGGQMDSLADIVNFGVAPSLVVYIAILHKAHPFGWIAALLYTVATSLRLARFNIMNERDNKATWQDEYFVGVPAPFGAILLLCPMYISFLNVPITTTYSYIFAAYTIIIGFLLCSRLPVWSGKITFKNIRRDLVLPAILSAVIYIALIMSFTWEVLTVSVFIYIILLPLSAHSWKKRYGTLIVDTATSNDPNTQDQEDFAEHI
ncbi:CDP-diacylglycerol--serine O-phosphatidyltransferase [Liberibacter crescens]|nr:CDP-diacylglycerol--serine O-phosphatidyltransferase [Liberibacter crescens]